MPAFLLEGKPVFSFSDAAVEASSLSSSPFPRKQLLPPPPVENHTVLPSLNIGESSLFFKELFLKDFLFRSGFLKDRILAAIFPYPFSVSFFPFLFRLDAKNRAPSFLISEVSPFPPLVPPLNEFVQSVKRGPPLFFFPPPGPSLCHYVTTWIGFVKVPFGPFSPPFF